MKNKLGKINLLATVCIFACNLSRFQIRFLCFLECNVNLNNKPDVSRFVSYISFIAGANNRQLS